ncbi:MAG: nuclear transport factor 2 family protein [Candidatus Eremiobacteraeota bacterium]|nr:nuclear transport factor 2 family protein [Candidatus Eremiobacteraeota bacterium]MBV9646319.1 nuclear transport factor 2 family protein [Candidatus Eremiobacteraeota bacterium]
MNAAELVERFASALDRDDYETAAQYLETDAVYDSGQAIIEGAPAILASFRATSEWGRRHLDRLEFLHEIGASDPNAILFIDRLHKAGETLTARHTMHVELSKDHRICALRLESPAGEDERVKAFFHRHGLQR